MPLVNLVPTHRRLFGILERNEYIDRFGIESPTNIGLGRVGLCGRVRVENGEHVPPVLVNVAQSLQLLLRVGEITNAGLVVHVLKRINALRLAILTPYETTGLLRRISAR